MSVFSNFITAFLVLTFVLNWDVSAAETPAMTGYSKKAPRQQSTSLKTAKDLRGVYYNPPEEGQVNAVGRLAVLLLTEEADPREVNLHHRFHTGESFQFMVSSNQDGWLYILHRSPGGDPQLLWPRVNFGETVSHLDLNRVQAGQEWIVPASPGKFTFDDEVGNEYFYVVIRPKRRPPDLTAMESVPASGSGALAETNSRLDEKETTSARPAAEPPSRPKTSQKIVQFSVRGPKHPIRGVVYDPGPKAADPHTYFSAHPDDSASDIVFEFQLLHEK